MEASLVHILLWPARRKSISCMTDWMLHSIPTTSHYVDGASGETWHLQISTVTFFGFTRRSVVGNPQPQHTLLSYPIVFWGPAFRFWMYGSELLSFYLSTTPQGASHTFIRLESVGFSCLNDASVYPPAVPAIGCSKTLMPRDRGSFLLNASPCAGFMS